MKMSDVFALPVSVDATRIRETITDDEICGHNIGRMSFEELSRHAAHAINQHDALVEALIDIIICAPSHGPLWHGSDEIKRAKEVLSRE